MVIPQLVHGLSVGVLPLPFSCMSAILLSLQLQAVGDFQRFQLLRPGIRVRLLCGVQVKLSRLTLGHERLRVLSVEPLPLVGKLALTMLVLLCHLQIVRLRLLGGTILMGSDFAS